MLKKLTASIEVFGALVGIAILTFIAVNLFDETLYPKITTLLNRPVTQQIKSENAYYPLLGLHSKNTVTPYEAAIFLEKKYQALSGDQLEKSSIDIKDFKEIGYTPFVKGMKDICNVSSNEDCLKDYSKRKSDYEKSINLNKLLLSRYTELLNYKSFYEVQDDSNLRWSHEIFRIQKLFHAQIALKWLYKNKKDALNSLNKDIHFWRMVMGSETGLIGKMISVAIIEKDIHLLSQFISDCVECSIYQNEINKALTKLTKKELSLRSALEREFLHIDSTLINVLNNKNFTFGGLVAHEAFSIVYQVNSTRNEMFDYFDTILKHSENKHHSILNMYQRVRDYEKEIDYGELNIFDLFYNPVGKILITIAVPSSGKYVVAPYRIQALSNLVKIKQRIIKGGIKKDQVIAFLENLPIELTSSLFLEPPKYSKSDNEIYYNFIDDGRIFLKL